MIAIIWAEAFDETSELQAHRMCAACKRSAASAPE